MISGTRYKVLRKPTHKELMDIDPLGNIGEHPGFNWNDHMNNTIGKEGIPLKDGYPGVTVYLCFPQHVDGDSYYPYCVLERIN